MKKIISIMMTLAMIFALVFAFCACGKEKSAYQIYTEAVKKNQELDSYELDLKMNMSVEADGVSMEVPLSYSIKSSGVQSGSPVFSGEMEMTISGITINVPVYSDGKYMYTELMGTKRKQPVEDGDNDLQEMTDTVLSMFSEDKFEGVVAVKNDDGTKSIDLPLDNETFQGAYSNLVDSMLGNLGEETADLNPSINVSDAKVSVVINKDGYIEKVDLKCDLKLTMSAEGESVDMNVSLDMSGEYKNIGSEVTVTAPSDLDEYEEVDYGF